MKDISGSLATVDAIGFIGTKIYLPWYWAEAMLTLQDSNTLATGLYVECKIDKLFYTFNHLFSVEGLIDLAARGAGTPMAFINAGTVFTNPEAKASEMSESIGEIVSLFLDFKI